MKFEVALKRAAQGDRIASMAARGSASIDEADDIRAARALCDDVLQAQHSSPVGRRIADLAGWIQYALRGFECGQAETALPTSLRDTLRDVGEELRDSAENELDRQALSQLKRMLRKQTVSRADQWALQRVLRLVDFDGFIDPWQDAVHLRSLRQSVNELGEPVPIDSAVAREMRQVLSQFA